MMKPVSYLYALLLKPRAANPDDRRQEFILNLLLSCLLLGAVMALSVAILNSLSTSVRHYDDSLTVNIIFSVLISALLILSRRGYFRLSAFMFIGLLGLAALQLIIAWGFMLQSALLLQVLIIVIAGILMSARVGLFVSIAIAIANIIISVLDKLNYLVPDVSWASEPHRVGDAVGYAILFIVIGLVTWLSNREIGYSLKRARASEAALAAERDNLEIKVKERTHQLEEAQLVRLMELQRFAEFGRLNANLLHEIANPLTAAKLNLELIGDDNSKLFMQVSKNLKHMEQYINAARQQIRGTTVIKSFAVQTEIKKLLKLLTPRATKTGVQIDYLPSSNALLKGDPVKFSQLLANLLVNAIDAYAAVTKKAATKIIKLEVTDQADFIIIKVTDYGKGLSKDQIERIFEPFYTTKAANHRSLGIGLVMVKQFVEQDFGGSIKVSSSKTKGTVFTVSLRRQRAN